MTQNIDVASHPDEMRTIDDLKRRNAIKASRTMLLMQWPVYPCDEAPQPPCALFWRPQTSQSLPRCDCVMVWK